ncbi:MAG: hypothetical protein ACOC6E_01665 [Thermodesulfobacteriota bacterium]
MRELTELSPLKVLERSRRGELGKGNLGVLIAGAGLGKTSCLVHIAFDSLVRGEKLIHVSLRDSPEKIASYYEMAFTNLTSAHQLEEEGAVRDLMERNRIILAYLKESFGLDRLRKNLENFTKEIHFKPDTLIVDGVDFTEAGKDFFDELKELAEIFEMEIWLSALSTEAEAGTIPCLYRGLADAFSVIVLLISSHEGVFLRLLRDHERASVADTAVRLDPNTFLAVE